MAPFSLPERRRVPWWTGPSVFAVLVILMVLFSIILRVLMTHFDPEVVLGWVSSPVGLSVQVIVMSLVFGGFAVAVPVLWQVSPKAWLCLNHVPPLIYAWSVLGVLGIGFLVDELIFLLHTLNPQFFDPAGLDMFNRLFVAASPGVFIFLTVVITFGPGIAEELFFRGLMMRSLLSSAPAWAAVGMSAVLFGLIHFDVLQSPGAALIGVYLGLVALRSNSVYPAMVAHGVNNLACALFARFADPNASGPVTEGHPAWLLGVAAFVLFISMVFLFRQTRIAKA